MMARRGLTHSDGIDLADHADGRGSTVEDVDGVRQTRLINQDLPVVLLVLLIYVSITHLINTMRHSMQRTIIHLLPSSSSSLGGFLTNVAGFLPTAGGAFFWPSGTAPVPRSSGFLCVICEGSTFFNPEVTEPPRFKSASKAACPPPAPPVEGLGGDWKSAGGGGGGGGGPPGAAGADEGVDEAGMDDGAG